MTQYRKTAACPLFYSRKKPIYTGSTPRAARGCHCFVSFFFPSQKMSWAQGAEPPRTVATTSGCLRLLLHGHSLLLSVPNLYHGLGLTCRGPWYIHACLKFRESWCFGLKTYKFT